MGGDPRSRGEHEGEARDEAADVGPEGDAGAGGGVTDGCEAGDESANEDYEDPPDREEEGKEASTLAQGRGRVPPMTPRLRRCATLNGAAGIDGTWRAPARRRREINSRSVVPDRVPTFVAEDPR